MLAFILFLVELEEELTAVRRRQETVQRIEAVLVRIDHDVMRPEAEGLLYQNGDRGVGRRPLLRLHQLANVGAVALDHAISDFRFE
jgi:hypothetical protein